MTVQGRTEYDTLRRSVHNSQARQIVGALCGNPQFAPLGRGLPPLQPRTEKYKKGFEQNGKQQKA